MFWEGDHCVHLVFVYVHVGLFSSILFSRESSHKVVMYGHSGLTMLIGGGGVNLCYLGGSYYRNAFTQCRYHYS